MAVEFLDAGRLRTRLVLEVPIRALDAAGGHVVDWQASAEFFGHVEPARAVAVIEGEAGRQAITHRVTLRYRTDLRPAMRLRRGETALRIDTVRDLDGTRRYLVCGCTEMEGET